jgi:hypothetical protein
MSAYFSVVVVVDRLGPSLLQITLLCLHAVCANHDCCEKQEPD